MEQTWFRIISDKVTGAAGSSWASVIACLLVISWVVGGFISGFTDTYQLIINTSTTIITFIMVFLIQGTQNRDNRAIHLKLDELIIAIENASDDVIELESGGEERLAAVKSKHEKQRDG